MRCSGPWWRLLKRSMGRSCDVNEHDPGPRGRGRVVADGSLEAVGGEGGDSSDGAVPRRSHAYPDGIVLRVLHHLRAQVGNYHGSGLDIRRRRSPDRQRPPDPLGLLVLAAVGISVRTVVYLFNSNNFVYFVQPILRTVVTGAFFALSVVVGRPLIARFAADFCLLSSEVEGRPAVALAVRRLTYLWAAVNGLVATASLTLLLTVPVGCLSEREMAAVWVITCIGVVLTVSDSGSNGPPRRARHCGCRQRATACLRHVVCLRSTGGDSASGHHRSRQTMPKAAPARRSPPIGPS